MIKHVYFFVFIFFYFSGYSQKKTIIQLKVPNKDDVVYITGNQSSLGNWDYDEVKMYKVSDFYRMIALELDYPAEFKFSRGSKDTEGIHKSLGDNPNIKLNDTLNKVAYRLKGWRDELLKSQLNIGFQYLPFQSRVMEEERTVKVYLPKDYTETKQYPVLYLTDANAKKFKIVTSTLESLSTSPYNAIPECILVGISQSSLQMELNTALTSSANTFKEFILTELLPLINEKFSTSGFNGIIGHDLGSDFNQLLMITDYNPITAYVNIGLELNPALKPGLNDFFKSYNKRKIFYYLSHPYYSNLESKQSFEELVTVSSRYNNNKIDFYSEELKVSQESLFSASVKDGLLHLFKDYRNLDNYKDFTDYAENYQNDMVLTYRIKAELEPLDINFFASQIVEKKDTMAYDQMTDYLDKMSLTVNNSSLKFTALDKAIHYHRMEMYDTSLTYWNKTLSGYNSNNTSVIDPENFYDNFSLAVETYSKNNNPEGAVQFLKSAIEALPQYALEFHFYISKVTLEAQLEKSIGKASLLYCVEHFEPNVYFTKDDMRKLVYAFDE